MNKKLKILVADESAELRSKLYSALVKNEAVESCKLASGGAQAMELLKSESFDCLFIDLVLSEVDGFAVIEFARSLERPPQIAVMTMLSHDAVIERAIRLGVFYYVIKPFDTSAICKRVVDAVSATERSVNRAAKLSHAAATVKSLEERVANMFLAVGIPAHIKGYHFLREAVKQVYASRSLINAITKELYPSVAKKFETTASKVERAIRHAIEVAWARGKIQNINGIFGYTIYGKQEKPTNGEFIALVADKLLMDDLTRREQAEAM